MDIYNVKNLSTNNSYKKTYPSPHIFVTFTDSHNATVSLPLSMATFRKNHLTFSQLSEAKRDIVTQATLQQVPEASKRKWIWKVNKAVFTSVLQSPTDTQAFRALKACIPEEQWTFNSTTQLVIPYTDSLPPPSPSSPDIAPPPTMPSPVKITVQTPESRLTPLTIDPYFKVPIDKAVITPMGNTFDETALLNHLRISQTDPISKTPLLPSDLLDNLTVSLIIHQLPEILAGKKRSLLCPILRLPFEDPVIINHTTPEGAYLMTLIDPTTQFGLFGEGISYNRACFDTPDLSTTLDFSKTRVLIPNRLLSTIIEILSQ
jgi:hypothetical protein